MSDFSHFLPFFTSISKAFNTPAFFLEQYITPIEILEHYFALLPSCKSACILDLGVGTGILSLMVNKKEAKSVIGIDIDSKALKIAHQNALSHEVTNLNLIHSAVEFFNVKKFRNSIDGVIMNPPFGTKRKFLDFVFLKKAMDTNGWILTLHKDNPESNKKISLLCKNNCYSIGNQKELIYRLPNTHKIHKMEFYDVKVIMYLLVPDT